MTALFGWMFEPANLGLGAVAFVVLSLVLLGVGVLLLAWSVRQDRKLRALVDANPSVAVVARARVGA